MIRLAHISDLHFGREIPELIQALVQFLNHYHPDLTIISGDLTQRATSRQFQKAAVFLSRLSHPTLVVPGNHDISLHKLIERFRNPYKKWHRYIKTPLEPLVDTPGFMVQGLNTARRIAHKLDWSRGRLSHRQVEKTEQAFSLAQPQSVKIIAAHHPFWLPSELAKKKLVGGQTDALERFSRSGIDLVLGGHAHEAYIHVSHGVIICHAGTSTSNRIKNNQVNSLNLISGDRTALTIERLIWKKNQFQSCQTKQFAKSSGQWVILEES